MAYIMQGDEYGLGVKLSLTDGTVVTPDIVQDVEITLGRFRKTYKSEEITFDDGRWVFPLTQSESFWLRGKALYEARVKFSGGDVIGTWLETIEIIKSQSKVKL